MSRSIQGEYNPEDIRDIVQSLMSGMSLARVPEEIHQQLLMPLSAAKNEAIVAGNTTAVKRIQGIMRELRLNPGQRSDSRKSKSAATSAMVTSRSLKPEKKDDLELLVDELIDGRQIETVDETLIPQLVPTMKAKKEILIAKGDYRNSQLLENLIQEANSLNYESEYRSIQNSKLTNLQLQLMQAKADYEAADNYWKEQKASQEAEYEDTLQQLEEQQAQQLQDYDNSYPEILPANYRKLSPVVLQLREQEKHLVLTKRYEDAIPFRERADRLEEQELEQQRVKFEKAFMDKRAQLVEAQNNQHLCFERNWQRKWERYEKERNHEISVLKRTIANFEKKIAEVDLNPNEQIPPSAPKSARRSATTSRATTKSVMRPSPSAVHPRIRNVAASRMTQRAPVSRRLK